MNIQELDTTNIAPGHYDTMTTKAGDVANFGGDPDDEPYASPTLTGPTSDTIDCPAPKQVNSDGVCSGSKYLTFASIAAVCAVAMNI